MEDNSYDKLKSQPLYIQAKQKIVELIKSGAFPGGKLPSEKELSEKMGVSRATTREALMALSREGMISKKQGLGTLYHLSSLKARMRIDSIGNFVNLLEDGGYKVEVKRLQFRWIEKVPDVDLYNDLSAESNFLQSEVVHYADSMPAIHSHIIIPGSVLSGSYFDIKTEAERTPAYSLNSFLNAYSREEVSHSISRFRPLNIDEKFANFFGVEEGTAVIGWNETSYSILDSVLCRTRVLFHPDLIDFSMIRKWE